MLNTLKDLVKEVNQITGGVQIGSKNKVISLGNPDVLTDLQKTLAEKETEKKGLIQTITERTSWLSQLRAKIKEIIERRAKITSEITSLDKEITDLRSELDSINLQIGVVVKEISGIIGKETLVSNFPWASQFLS